MADAAETTITWDLKNWVTVVLMVAIGFGLLVLAAQLVRQGPGLLSKANVTPAGLGNSPPLG